MVVLSKVSKVVRPKLSAQVTGEKGSLDLIVLSCLALMIAVLAVPLLSLNGG